MILEEFEEKLRRSGLGNGSVIVISSDVKKLLIKLMQEDRKNCNKRKKVDEYLDDIIDMFQKIVGDSGTLLFHTFYWNFCHGKAFDYKNTMSETGILSNRALKRGDFIRTRHPIYSFAVWGKDAMYLANLENTDAFAADSPFEYMRKNNAVYVSIDIDAWSYFHYIEQSNNVEYRFIKKFTAPYVKDGISENKTYSMFVRYLCLDVEQLPFWEKWLAKKTIYVSNIRTDIIDCNETYIQVSNDIINNEGRNLVVYNREMAANHLQVED
ncbi:MAG: AAC(3) family N-acetyltransferase [Lachnospiraceae bacterium]|nr:AAC(3) family N-acetyltransferase [Lachnospiraceae bacterium]